MKLVCVGDCCTDRYTIEGADRPGGITFNFAWQARRHFPGRWDVAVLTALGDDPSGNTIARALQSQGIRLHAARLPGTTPVQEIELQPDGERHFLEYAPGVLEGYRMGPEEQRLIAGADLLVTPHYQQIEELFLSVMASPSPGLRAVDFADFAEHPRFELLERCRDALHIAFFGLRADQDTLIRELAGFARRHGKLFVVTLAAAGSRAFYPRGEVAAPAVPVPRVVDTTGAGDSFAAGFLGRYCAGGDPREALEAGARAAAVTIAHSGGTP